MRNNNLDFIFLLLSFLAIYNFFIFIFFAALYIKANTTKNAQSVSHPIMSFINSIQITSSVFILFFYLIPYSFFK